MSCTHIKSHLRALARQRIEQSRLPATTRINIWGGHGNGQVCSLCDEPIRREEIEYELDDGGVASQRIFRFHLHCHGVWEGELTDP
jgi:hypothetical protein